MPVGLLITGCERFLNANVHGFVRSVLTDLAERTGIAGSGFRLDVFSAGDWPLPAPEPQQVTIVLMDEIARPLAGV